MPKLQVFDPAMCCPTGVCGPAVDPDLVRFAADLDWLATAGVEVERFNLSQEPAAFVASPLVVEAMRRREDALPLLLLDGEIVGQGRYPERAALAALAGIPLAERQLAPGEEPKAAAGGCCPPADAAPAQPARSGGKCC